MAIYRWSIFYLERNRGRKLVIHRNSEQKPSSIKLNFSYPRKNIEFLDTGIYKSANGKLYLQFFVKQHIKKIIYTIIIFEGNIPYFQDLRISNIWAEAKEMAKPFVELKKAFLKRCYQGAIINVQFNCFNDLKEHIQTKKIDPKTFSSDI